MTCLALSSRRVHVTQHSLFFHFFPTSSNLSFTSHGPKTPSVNSPKTSSLKSPRTWSQALFIAFARYSTIRADCNRTVNAHQLPNEVHQLHGRRSPTLPSMFTNLSQNFTKFHQRTTEDQKLIVEFHSTFSPLSGYAPLCRTSSPCLSFLFRSGFPPSCHPSLPLPR